MALLSMCRSVLLAGTCLIGMNGLAEAQTRPQDSDGSGPEETGAATDEIVVTARSGAESLTQVPVAVSAFGAADIARYQSSDLVKLAQMTPAVQIYGGGAGAGGAFLIRGIGTTADTAGVDSSVSIALDGSQMVRPRTVLAGMFDLRQMEVMKGPQALFFGRNSSAGVISISSQDPGSTLSGYVTGGYEFKARERYVEAALTTPVSDTLSIRWATRYSKLRGWVYNVAVAHPDVSNPSVTIPAPVNRWGPGSESISGRVTVLWTPASNYTSKFKAFFSKYTDDGYTSTIEPVCAGAHPLTLGQPDLLSDCKVNGRIAQSILPSLYTTQSIGDQRWNAGIPFTDSRSTLLTWQQTLDLGTISLVSNTTYSVLDNVARGSNNYTQFVEFSGGTDEHYRGGSQELRLISDFGGPFNITVGGYYEKTKSRFAAALFLYNFGPNPTPGPYAGSYQAGYETATERRHSWSGFVQARYDLAPNIELAAGARYTETHKNVVQGQPYVHGGYQAIGALLPQGVFVNSVLDEHNVSPEATLTWHPTASSTLYGAFKTGYKSGGIAIPALVTPANTAANLIFRPEKSIGGEIGYKAVVDRLRIAATAYYYKFKGLQLTSFDPTSSSYRIQNAADAKQRGIEVEASYALDNALSLRGSVNWNDVTYGAYLNSACYTGQTAAQGCVGGVQDLTGRRLHRAPLWSGSAGITYEAEIGPDHGLSFTNDYRYSSDYLTSEVQSPLSRQKDYVLINASINFYPQSKAWQLSLIGRNLGNIRVYEFQQDRPGGITGNELAIGGGRPREIAIQGTVKF